MIVPLRRTLNGGEHGRDVTAVQRALNGAALRATTPNRKYDKATVSQIKLFQASRKLHVDGIYGPQTHKALARYFDAYGAWLMGVPRQQDTQVGGVRAHIVSTAVLGYNKRDEIHYTQGPRRMEGVRRKILPPAVPHYEDCSSFATWCYWVGGAPDPNGQGYNGQGYTGTLAQHGRRVRLDDAKPGDLILYGHGAPWQHVAIYVGHGRVISHGSERGPFLLPVRYRGDLGEIRSYLP